MSGSPVLRPFPAFRHAFIAALPALLPPFGSAQQVPDLAFVPRTSPPAYTSDAGPRVAIDEGHHNFHTIGGRYGPFAGVLRRDGYRVAGISTALSPATLHDVAVLVIANPLHARNRADWSLPTPSAYTSDEIKALRAWVEEGGALLLMVDHMPFPGGAGDLARAFGFEFSNGFVGRKSDVGGHITFGPRDGLGDTPVTQGRSAAERIRRVTTFTGSAFKVPADAKRVLVLGADCISREPVKAWDFTRTTPQVSVGGWCQGALLSVGRGRVAVFGEAAMFTAQRAGANRRPVGFNHPDAPENARFLLNVLHWLTRTPGMPD